jgi:hypothetical protein
MVVCGIRQINKSNIRIPDVYSNLLQASSSTLHLLDEFIPQLLHVLVPCQFLRLSLILQEPVLLSRERLLEKVKVTTNFGDIAPIFQVDDIEGA